MQNRIDSSVTNNDSQTIVFSVPKLREIAEQPPGRLVYYGGDSVLLVPEDVFRGLQSRGVRAQMSVAAILRDKVSMGFRVPAEWVISEEQIPRWKAAYKRWRGACTVLESESIIDLREAA